MNNFKFKDKSAKLRKPDVVGAAFKLVFCTFSVWNLMILTDLGWISGKSILKNLPFFRFFQLFKAFLRKVAGIWRFLSINKDGENGVLWIFGLGTGIFLFFLENRLKFFARLG